MEEIVISFKGVSLRVEGNYDKAESSSLDYPGSPSSFEIYNVFAEDSDVSLLDLFSEDDFRVMEESVISIIED